MKISFYYVEPDYINYIKKVEIKKHGFTTVPVASMRFNYMIPVPKRCLISVDFKSSQFTEKEKIMFRKEYKACIKY